MRVPGRHSRGSSSGTTACSAAAGAPGSTPSTPRRHSLPRATAPSRSRPEELPNIQHRKEYEAALDRSPDYRITCIFVDKKYRRKGLTAIVLHGAVDLIAQAGGGVVEGYPHDNAGQKMSVLYNSTRSLYERAGFSYLRPKGKRNCVMRRVVP